MPTIGGLFLFGGEADRREFVPDAWILAGRFAGTDRRQISDTAQVRSLPVKAVEVGTRFRVTLSFDS